ncbi:MAG: hypothetical protein M3Q03_18655 [Chloroflexota bacterium]|nr:hypothetical protein [Chloroflexota bacterium]
MEIFRGHPVGELEAVEPVAELDQDQVVEVLPGNDRGLDVGRLEDAFHPARCVEGGAIGRGAEPSLGQVVGTRRGAGANAESVCSGGSGTYPDEGSAVRPDSRVVAGGHGASSFHEKRQVRAVPAGFAIHSA